MTADCSTIQLINGQGQFNVADLDKFVQGVNLSDCGLSYAVVAIMGPQSSGKSTLLNHLFCTEFVTMDPRLGRSQTTKGIWMAKAVDIYKPLTVIMDIEGNDGQERGQDVTFEKQSTLLALALADVVLINMWHSDMGRENGANKPLLRTVFQAMLKLFSPRKTTLLFVVRDADQDTPLNTLSYDLKNIIRKIWEEVPKPKARKNTALEEFFIVKVVALPHFKLQNAEFKNEVEKLKEQFNNSIDTGGLAGSSQGRAPGLAFSMSAQKLWNDIKDNKDLDVPALNVMVATFRCDLIVIDKFSLLLADKSLQELMHNATSGPVYDFGIKLSSILEFYLARYEDETMYFDEGVRQAKRQELVSKMLEHVHPAYERLLGHLGFHAKERFESDLDKALRRGQGFALSVHNCKQTCLDEFDRQCQVVKQAPHWNSNKVRAELESFINAHSSSLGDNLLAHLVVSYEKKLRDSLGVATESELSAATCESWRSIRAQFEHDTDSAEQEFLHSINGFEFDDATTQSKLQTLREYATSVVENKAKIVGNNALYLMKDRFSHSFKYDEDLTSRQWDKDEDIMKFANDARTKAQKILGVLAIIRLDEKPDNVERHLTYLCGVGSPRNGCPDNSGALLNSNVWEGVSAANTIIAPQKCKSYWEQFLAATDNDISLAKSLQDATKRTKLAEARTASAIQMAENANRRPERDSAGVMWAKLAASIFLGPLGGPIINRLLDN